MIDLYTVPTANGQKVHIMLEECGLPYTPHLMDLYGGQHRTPEFRKLNPFSRVPIIVDHDGPGGEFAVCETIAILTYLAEKSGKFLPTDPRGRSEVNQWLSFVATNIGPLFRGEFMFANVVPGQIRGAVEYFVTEADKALAVLNEVLSTRTFLVAETYTIADINAYPVAATSSQRLPKGLEPYPHIRRWAEAIAARPAVASGMKLFAP
ncbi:MAG: glutathione S-transferase family protein [Rhodospirillaceae bacterium]|nr:glutathione S-transferase family protein [Rhodospirillaceae bacterium]